MKFGLIECGVILFSASMFGLAHVEFWDMYKIVPVAVGGIFFAYLFMKFGLYAAIILHFVIDFFFTSMTMISPILAGIMFLLSIIVGLFAFDHYSGTLSRFIFFELMKRPRPDIVGEMKPIFADHDYLCTSCDARIVKGTQYRRERPFTRGLFRPLVKVCEDCYAKGNFKIPEGEEPGTMNPITFPIKFVLEIMKTP